MKIILAGPWRIRDLCSLGIGKTGLLLSFFLFFFPFTPRSIDAASSRFCETNIGLAEAGYLPKWHLHEVSGTAQFMDCQKVPYASRTAFSGKQKG